MLKELSKANAERQKEWDPTGQLSLSYRGNELAGEVGEACNILKKLDREKMGIPGSRSNTEALAEELADVLICVDLIATATGINLEKALVDKFNFTSKKYGFKTRIKANDIRDSFDKMVLHVAKLTELQNAAVAECEKWRDHHASSGKTERAKYWEDMAYYWKSYTDFCPRVVELSKNLSDELSDEERAHAKTLRVECKAPDPTDAALLDTRKGVGDGK